MDPKFSIETMRQGAKEGTKLMRALSHEGRLMLLCALCDCEKSVGELAEITSLSQSALSQHLAKLRADGLVETRRESTTIYYSLKVDAAREVITVLHKNFCPS